MNNGLKKLFLRFIKENDIINHYPNFKQIIFNNELNRSLYSYSVFDEMIRWECTKEGWCFWYLIQLRYAYIYYMYSLNKLELRGYNYKCRNFLYRLTCVLDNMDINDSTELIESVRQTRDNINNSLFKNVTNVFSKNI